MKMLGRAGNAAILLPLAAVVSAKVELGKSFPLDLME